MCQKRSAWFLSAYAYVPDRCQEWAFWTSDLNQHISSFMFLYKTSIKKAREGTRFSFFHCTNIASLSALKRTNHKGNGSLFQGLMMCLFPETMLSQHALLPLRPAPQDTLTSVTSDTLLEADTA